MGAIALATGAGARPPAARAAIANFAAESGFEITEVFDEVETGKAAANPPPVVK